MTTLYVAVKHIHILCVVLSLTGFVVRGIWMLTGNALLRCRPVKILPHVVDTFLLLSALTLTVLLGQYPLSTGWLTAKVLGLCLYVVLGTIALKRGRTLRIRASAFAAAIIVFIWIVSVALTRNPDGFLAAWGSWW